MDEGTISVVVKLPSPWPPSQDAEILAPRHVHRLPVSLIADPEGRLRFLRTVDGQTATLVRSQPIRAVGGSAAVLIVTWRGTDATLYLNGRPVPPETAEGDFILEPTGEPDPVGRILPDISPTAVVPDDARLLLRTLQDIEQKLQEDTEYAVLRAAGLLRQLLLDDTPLVHAVNRRYGRRLEFEVVESRDDLAVQPDIHWRTLDPSGFPGAMTTKVGLKEFLRAPVLTVGGTTATVRDLIRACANVKGGVHLGKARTEAEGAIVDWDRVLGLAGWEPSLRALRGVCRIVLRGLLPLVRDMTRANGRDP